MVTSVFPTIFSHLFLSIFSQAKSFQQTCFSLCGILMWFDLLWQAVVNISVVAFYLSKARKHLKREKRCRIWSAERFPSGSPGFRLSCWNKCCFCKFCAFQPLTISPGLPPCILQSLHCVTWKYIWELIKQHLISTIREALLKKLCPLFEHCLALS